MDKNTSKQPQTPHLSYVKYKCKVREVTLPLPKIYLQQLHVQLHSLFSSLPMKFQTKTSKEYLLNM
jgi:hypothetical protein